MIDAYRDTSGEVKLIAYILRKNYKIADDIDSEIFSVKAYKMFFDICAGIRSTLPSSMLKDKLKERIKEPQLYLDFILRVYKCKIDQLSNKNIGTIISKLRKLSYFRIAMEKTEEIVDCIGEGKEGEVRKLAKQIATIGIKRRKVYVGDLLKDFEERKAIIKARMEMDMVGIPTGITEFDRISGGILKGEFGVVMSETGMGKSICLENFALSAWEQGYNIIYVSVEMPKSQVQFRADSRLARLQYTKFRLGEFSEKELIKWEKRIKQYRMKRKNYFEVVCLPRSCNAQQIEMESERIQDKHGKEVNLIVADYLNIMQPNVKEGSSKGWESQVDIAWELKELAADFMGEGVAIWSGNQVTDKGEGAAELKKSHVKYGRGIIEVAQIFLGLVQTQDDELENIMHLQTVKLRDLPHIAPITLRPNFDFMMIDDERIGLGSLARI